MAALKLDLSCLDAGAARQQAAQAAAPAGAFCGAAVDSFPLPAVKNVRRDGGDADRVARPLCGSPIGCWAGNGRRRQRRRRQAAASGGSPPACVLPSALAAGLFRARGGGVREAQPRHHHAGLHLPGRRDHRRGLARLAGLLHLCARPRACLPACLPACASCAAATAAARRGTARRLRGLAAGAARGSLGRPRPAASVSTLEPPAAAPPPMHAPPLRPQPPRRSRR